MEDPEAMVSRLLVATNEHELEALVSCFAEDYDNQTPAHPSRSFVGREQVGRNWEQIFAFIPDLSAKVLSQATNGDNIWTEWEMRGTRRDATIHHMRGVVIFGVRDGLASSARFYLEPVDEDTITVDDAVRDRVVR